MPSGMTIVKRRVFVACASAAVVVASLITAGSRAPLRLAPKLDRALVEWSVRAERGEVRVLIQTRPGRAQAVSAGGESGDPKSPHFNDQATRYASGNLRDVYFYRADVERHKQRLYHPGE